MELKIELDLGGGGINVPLLVCFAAFVVTFVTTRTITRMIRAGKGPFKDNVSESGLHVHHAVPGIILLVAGAFMAVGTSGSGSAWTTVAALLVGVGTSLVLDEFALILHLQDVYWADEGRVSVEMVSLAMACLGLAVVGLTPFNFSGFEGGAESVIVVSLVIAAVICGDRRERDEGQVQVGALRRVHPRDRDRGRDPARPTWVAVGEASLRHREARARRRRAPNGTTRASARRRSG